MPQRRSGSTLIFIGALLLGIAIFALVMVVMGTRLEKDVSPAPATPQEIERQNLAVRTQAIADDGGELAVFGEEWTNALGGVWIPWPDGAPEDYTNPPLPDPGPADVHEAMLELSESALSSDLGPVTTAIGISALSLSASEAGQCGDYDLATVASVAKTGVAVENIEMSRQWLEQDAARMALGERDDELARIELLSDLLDAQLAAGAPDTRPALVFEADEGTHVSAAYKTVIDQLTFSAMTANVEGKKNVAAFVCHLNQWADAPQIEPLPGLVLTGTASEPSAEPSESDPAD